MAEILFARLDDTTTNLAAETAARQSADLVLQANITAAIAGAQPVDPTLTSLAALDSSAGYLVETAADVFTKRSLVAPAAGFTITNPAATAGNSTFVLANDLASLEAIAGTNVIPYRSATDTWGTVTVSTGLGLTAGTLAIDSTVVTLTGAQALTNKTINGNTISSGTGTLALNTNAISVESTGGAVIRLKPPNASDTVITLPGTASTMARTDAGQTFNGVQTFGNSIQVVSNSANALAVGLNGTTNPGFNVDTSTALSATGINIKSAAAGGAVAISVLSSNANEGLQIDAKGTSGITIGQINNASAINLGGSSPTINIGQTGSATLNVGKSNLASGTIVIAGSSSGATTIIPTAVASGTLTLPAATDTLVGKATSDTFTNKTHTNPILSQTAPTALATLGFNAGGTLNWGDGSANHIAMSIDQSQTVTNKSISGSGNTLSNIALSSHATQAAFTIVANNSGSAAAPTAVDISALTTKASPAGTDYLLLSDQAASGAFKKVTVTSVAAGSTVASIAGNTGAFTLSTGITNSVNDIRIDAAYGGRKLLATLTASNSATLSDTTSFTSSFKEYDIVFENVIPVTNLVSGEIQIHSGGAFQTTGYITAYSVFTSTGVTAGGGSTTFIPISQVSAFANTGSGVSGTFRLYGPVSTASVVKQWSGNFSHTGNGLHIVGVSGGYWNSTAAIDGIQILMSSGNIASGTVKIYGMN